MELHLKRRAFSWLFPVQNQMDLTVISLITFSPKSVTTLIAFTANTGVQYRRSRPVSRNASMLESKSPGFVNTRLVNYNRGVSYQPSMHSQSQYHPEPENIPPPTTENEKSKMTR